MSLPGATRRPRSGAKVSAAKEASARARAQIQGQALRQAELPYLNERLRRLDRRADLVLAPWDGVPDRRSLTYDAFHLNPEGAALTARTIQQAIQAEGRRQTKVVPPPPGSCG